MQDIEYRSLIPVEKDGGLLSDGARIRACIDPLLKWYRENRRQLAWREDPTPYHVWISEIMLQQTRVEAVKSYYDRFIEALPEIKDLAEVDDDRLMKLWQGLGYYSRARNLKKAAQIALSEYEGNLPADHEKLLKLPGIGPYTAGAIASIAFGIRRPAVDGNVFRVISRILKDTTPIDQPAYRKKIEELLLINMPEDCVGDFNQALMEIGALVCLPNGTPHCEECPLKGLCLACREKLTDQIPVKSPKKKRKIEEKTVLLISSGQEYAICKRPDKGLLAGLYEFPAMDGFLSEEKIREELGQYGIVCQSVEKLGEAKHIFSHVEWHMINYKVVIGEAKNYLHTEYVNGRKILDSYAIPNAYAKLLNRLEEECAD